MTPNREARLALSRVKPPTACAAVETGGIPAVKTRAPRSRSASKRTVESTTRPLETLRGPEAARERFRSDAIPLVQAALAAGLAWFVAHDLLGHPAPIFAPIGALLILSDAPGRRTSRVLAATLGAVIGIAVGDALVSASGTGAIQVTVVAVLAMSATAVLGASPAVVTNGHRGSPNRRRPAPARLLQPGRSAATRRCPDRRCDEPGGLDLVAGTYPASMTPLRGARAVQRRWSGDREVAHPHG